jgi:hypothetical protein
MRSRRHIIRPFHNLYVPHQVKKQEYWEKVLTIQSAYLTGFWRLNDTSGTTATDCSGNNRNGTYAGSVLPSLANAAGPDGVLCPYFSGGDYCRVSFTGAGQLREAFNAAHGKEGSMMIWAKVSDVANWTDGTNDLLFTLGYNSADEVHLKKDSGNNILIVQYGAGGAAPIYVAETPYNNANWFCAVVTWSYSGQKLRLYSDGVLLDSEHDALPEYTGVDGRECTLSAYTNDGSNWKGWLALAALWSVPLEQADITTLETI